MFFFVSMSNLLFSTFFSVFCILYSALSFAHRFVVFPFCFSGASNIDMLLLIVGLHKVRDGMSQLAGTVPFCVLVLGCTHSYFVFVFFHRGAFRFLLVITGCNTDVQHISA